MRTAHYAFILIAQIALLFVMFAFGARVLDVSPPASGGTTSVVGQSPTQHGLSTLRHYLSR
ncbi:MAG TPA: hypothetical protein VHZ06_09390 [Marmoricola sp.]|nr:hypothetical protein [Marmoricola sp.]